ncbi:unnamed protein product [Coffea canephora]|uniref:LOB domain-containing protein n=2 Tax=Coffea TaxID=13442 RepID=A0A068U726_COFCA|nr:LOB domain-containing protein 1-like [Coffea arabica]CDP04291.1 unnamed protein product [Coffea canephora]
MECSSTTTTTTTICAASQNQSLSPSSSPSLSPRAGSPKNGPPSPPPVILSPCAACKILRRRCAEKCVLAPYFPPTEPLKFTIAHKVFGASNIIKMLQELPEDQRADAVNSMVYEANSRIRDPVYGCAGAICQLQKQISELQAELAKAQAEMLNLQCQNDNLKSLICMGMAAQGDREIMSEQHLSCDNTSLFLDDANIYAAWEPLWT